MSDHIEKLEHLQSLKDKGTVTEEEFQSEKAKILSDQDSTLGKIADAVKPTEKNKKFRTIFFLALGLIALIGLISVIKGSGTPEGTPSYMKKVTAYKEGDGLVVYFILADESGQMIASSGNAHLKITGEYGTSLFEITLPMTTSDFHKTEVGMGNFKHDAVICSFGRIPVTSSGMGKVSVDFTHDGKTFSDNETVFF